MGTIEVLGIRVVGRHGVLHEEQVRSQPFEIDLRLEVDLTKAAASDRLEDTVDYGLLTEAVTRTVELESYRLLERLADRLAGICISAGAVDAVDVTVRKLRPPIPVHVGSVGVTIRREASAPRRGLLEQAAPQATAEGGGSTPTDPGSAPPARESAGSVV